MTSRSPWMCGRDRAQDGFDYVLVDGFTRTQAAKEAGRLTVTAYLHAFACVEEARDYAIHTQRDRRNLSDAELMSVLSLIDRKVTGFKTSSSLAPDGANGGPLAKTAQRTAKEIGTSARNVERARKVASDPDAAAAVKRGELSINKAYDASSERGRKQNWAPILRMGLKTKEVARATRSSSGSQKAVFASAVERLRQVLHCGVELAADGDGESGRIIISFKDHDQLHEVTEYICAPGPDGRPWDPVHMSAARGGGSPAAAAIVDRAGVLQGSRGRSPLAHGNLSRTRGRCSEYTAVDGGEFKTSQDGKVTSSSKSNTEKVRQSHGLSDPSIREDQDSPVLGRQMQTRHTRAPTTERRPRPQGREPRRSHDPGNPGGLRPPLGGAPKIRKDNVRAVEILVGFSPSEAARLSKTEQDRYFADAKAWFVKLFGGPKEPAQHHNPRRRAHLPPHDHVRDADRNHQR